MDLSAVPSPLRPRRKNAPPAVTTTRQTAPAMTVRTSDRAGYRYKPMTIRVVTSDDEQSSTESSDSGSDRFDSLGDSDDDVFMPILCAATAIPMSTQRAQARATTRTTATETAVKAARRKTPARADLFPAALKTFLQDESNLAQLAKVEAGPRNVSGNETSINALVRVSRGHTLAESQPRLKTPRLKTLPGSIGPASVPSQPPRLLREGATASQPLKKNMITVAGHAHPRPSSPKSKTAVSIAAMSLDELAETHAPAPRPAEKRLPTATAPSLPLGEQHPTKDLARDTDRPMERQESHAPAAQQQTTYAEQQRQHELALQQHRLPSSSRVPTPTAARPTSSTHMTQARMGVRPPHMPSGPRPGVPFQWQRPAPIKPAKALRRRAPGEVFAALPGEVLELILDELRNLHLENAETKTCATCWMRDAGAMALTARKMLKYARVALYESIELTGADHHRDHHPVGTRSKKTQKKLQAEKARAEPALLLDGTRLSLLQRTLHESPSIAAIVRRLRVAPAFTSTSPQLSTPSAALAVAYEALISSVIMACPNLERVAGYYPVYDHASPSSGVAQALSTRTRLKEAHWIVAPLLSPEQKELQEREQSQKAALLELQTSQKGRGRSKSTLHRKRAASPPCLPSPPMSPTLERTGGLFTSSRCATLREPTALLPCQSTRFLQHHVNWQHLSTLTVHCQPGATLTPATLLVDALMYLPALQNLYLSHLPAAAFDDQSLLALPPLKKLALVHLPGLTADGLSAYATRATSRSLVVLRLEHVALDALHVLARLLSKLEHLVSLAVVQPQAPALAPDEVIWLFPYLASPSLETLHWDVPGTAPCPLSAMTGDVVLARSIQAGGFPRLHQLRTPIDPEGMFQALCRPQEHVDLPRDQYRSLGAHDLAALADFPSPPSPSSPSFPPSAGHRRHRSESLSSMFSSSLGSPSRADSRASFAFSKASSPSSASSASSASAASSAEWSCTNLQQARVAAQSRIEAARRRPKMLVNVTDEHGRLVDKFGLAGFIGTLGSPIAYHLVPDAGATDEKGGLVDISDLLAASESREADGVCTGQWNASKELPPKKGQERWWHAERGRTRTVSLL
ncbi:hypothetical protein SEPCBS119000_004504 [Sporothrix epigloea]|uniref:F-box domain-containing protein n=1 Tax=Sporothrix epigloea TaxID=1892477 RepID=A0ABP0DSK1_9PEZI